MFTPNILIIGSSSAGLAAAEAARKTDPKVKITVLSADTHLPYHRPRLPEVVPAPEMKEQILLHDLDWYKTNEIDLRLDTTVSHVNTAKREAVLVSGAVLPYDRLIIASGSHSFVPPFEGHHLDGVFTLWTMSDALTLAKRLPTARVAAVIGGGLLGLEAAYALRKSGLKTTIVEFEDCLLKRQLDEKSSAIFQHQVEKLDINVVTSAQTEAILPDASDKKVAGLRLKDGREIPCDLLVIATGVRASLNFLEGEPIEIDRRLTVNERMETSVPGVYAAGDCACFDGRWYGLWSIAKLQGTVAGTNAAGGNEICQMPVPPYMVNTMETRIASAGTLVSGEPSLTSQINVDEVQLTYDRRNYIGNDLVGFILLGDTKPFSILSKDLRMSQEKNLL